MTVYSTTMTSRSAPLSPYPSPSLSYRFPIKDLEADRHLLTPPRTSDPHPPTTPDSPSKSSPFTLGFTLRLLLPAALWVVSLIGAILLFDRATSPFPHLSLGLPLPPSPSLLLPPLPPLPAYSSPTNTCILVRAFHKYYDHIPTFMSLMRHNAHPPNLFFNPTDSNSSVAELARRVERGNREAGYAFGHVLNVTEEVARAHFAKLNEVAEFGYAYTDASMDMLTELPHYRSMCTWIMITNVDNIYAGHFLDRVEKQLELGYQMVGFNTISHYDRVACCGDRQDTREGSFDDGTMHPIDIQWVVGGIDLGAAVWNISLWKQLDLNFIRMGQEVGHLDWADGMLFQKMVQANVSRVAIRQFLFIHQ